MTTPNNAPTNVATPEQKKLVTLYTQFLSLAPESKVAFLHDAAKSINLKVVDPSKAATPKKWETAQKFYEEALVKRTDEIIASTKAKKITWESGARKLMGTVEFNAEVVDFTPKGKERLKGELNRMVRKFSKETNVDYDKVIKVWDTPEPKVEAPKAEAPKA